MCAILVIDTNPVLVSFRWLYFGILCVLISCAVCRYLNSVVNSDLLAEEACDSDGEVIGQESSIFAVLEFISVLGESDSFQALLPPIFPQLLYLLLVYMQITQEQVRPRPKP